MPADDPAQKPTEVGEYVNGQWRPIDEIEAQRKSLDDEIKAMDARVRTTKSRQLSSAWRKEWKDFCARWASGGNERERLAAFGEMFKYWKGDFESRTAMPQKHVGGDGAAVPRNELSTGTKLAIGAGIAYVFRKKLGIRL